MSMLKVAGVDGNGQAKAFRIDGTGRTEIAHTWAAEEISVLDSVQIRDTEAAWTDRVNISGFATVSLRVRNSLDQPVAIVFGVDTGESNTTYLKNYGGSNLGFTIPSGSGIRLITPEEFPFLQYLKNIRIRYSCSTAPESGSLSIDIVGRY